MERKEIIVKTYEQLVRAVEILEADIIIVSGMIACAGRPIYLRSGQIVRGADKFSGLKFNFEDQARSVIFLEEFSKVQNLKIDVAANSYPSADRMQSALEVGGEFQHTVLVAQNHIQSPFGTQCGLGRAVRVLDTDFHAG